MLSGAVSGLLLAAGEKPASDKTSDNGNHACPCDMDPLPAYPDYTAEATR